MSPVNLWKCQRCGHDEADHLELQTIPLARLKDLVADEVNKGGKCNVEGCDCEQFKAALPEEKKE